MNTAILRNQLLAEIQHIPENRLEELHNLLHHDWQPKTIAQIQRIQGAKPFKQLVAYQADFVPNTENTDDWLNYFTNQHQQDIT